MFCGMGEGEGIAERLETVVLVGEGRCNLDEKKIRRQFNEW